MIHHVSVGTNDVERARAFYDPLMALLGYRNVRDYPHSLDYGVTDVVFSVETPVNGARASPGNGVHICFEAADRETRSSPERRSATARSRTAPISASIGSCISRPTAWSPRRAPIARHGPRWLPASATRVRTGCCTGRATTT